MFGASGTIWPLLMTSIYAVKHKMVHIYFYDTRLPSNLRPTTRKCMHLLTRGHFRSRDKDGGHTIGSARAENRML